MGNVTYTKPDMLDWVERGDGMWIHPDANGADYLITVQEPYGSTLYHAIADLIYAMTKVPIGQTTMLVTTEGWWSGYSEYTIEETWTTVVVTLPDMGWEKRWNSMAELFKELAEYA